MKVLVNGGLNLSELDGWWAEAWAPELGWAFGDGREHDHDPNWDDAEAEALYSTIENEVKPAFYDRDERGVPRAWVARMRRSMTMLAPRFSSNRMLREYAEGYYLPAARDFERRTISGGALAVEVTRWTRTLEEHWRELGFGQMRAELFDGQHRVSLEVALGEVDPGAVRVELYAEPRDGGGYESFAMTPAGEPDAQGRRLYTVSIPASRPVSDYTARIVPAHPEAAAPLEAPQILWNR